jgi:acyl-homoserine-lactone acylase
MQTSRPYEELMKIAKANALRASAIVLCLTVGVAAIPVPGFSAATERLRGHVDNGDRFVAEIRRTGYGIPHITADDFGSLGYGYGYAFAQDNVCVMAERVVTLRGERAKYLGGPDPDRHIDSDIYYKGVREAGVIERLLARPAPLGPTTQLRQLINGYVNGYNRYLRETPVGKLPDPTCRGALWITQITAMDIWSGIYDVNRLGGTAGFIGDIATAVPPMPGAAAPASAAAVPVPARVTGAGEGIGSNAWALGADATRGHTGMLLANPHFPWSGSLRFYQVHLTIPGVLNVSGASLYGVPVVQIGHTRNLAWTHTVSTANRFTLRRLTLVPGEPTSYLIDGSIEPMGRRNVTVTARDADGKPSDHSRTLYTSRYGPVLAAGWTTAVAYAIQDANADNLRSTNEWLALNQADNLTELHAAQRTYQGIPFTNTIAADATGTVFYADASVVPHVTDALAERCAITPDGEEGEVGGLVLDGSTVACDWGSDPDAVQPGVFGPDAYPQLTRTDYVANSNNNPQLTNPAAPLNYPRVFGGAGQLNLRARLGLDMITQRLGGSDGLGPAGFTLPTLQATMLDNRNHSADLGRADVVAMCRAHPTLTTTDGHRVDVRQGCAVLAGWNGRADLDTAGPVLWREFFERLSNAPASWWRVPYDPDHPITTPRGIDGGNPAVRHAFADTMQFFHTNHIPLTATLNTAQRYASIPVSGCPGGEGCFNAIYSADPQDDNRDSNVTYGSSFIMAVELTRNGPRTRTILTYSESANPDSPHHTDQTVLFARKQWIAERFTEAEIHADPHLRTTSLRS